MGGDRPCLSARPGARVEHGLGVNRAWLVLSQAFPSGAGRAEPDALRAALWPDDEIARLFGAKAANGQE